MRLIPSTEQLPPGVAVQATTYEPSYGGPLTVTLAAGRRGVSLPAGTCVRDLIFPHLVSAHVTEYTPSSKATEPGLPSDDKVCVLGPADLREGGWCAPVPASP
eukprot:15472981-Alexandrium_andersonii.AAC.1